MFLCLILVLGVNRFISECVVIDLLEFDLLIIVKVLFLCKLKLMLWMVLILFV